MLVGSGIVQVQYMTYYITFKGRRGAVILLFVLQGAASHLFDHSLTCQVKHGEVTYKYNI